MNREQLDRFDRIAIDAARGGIAIDSRTLRDNERCRQQRSEARAGVYQVMIDSNRYGWYVRPTNNLIEGGMRISPNFDTEAEARDWAIRHINEAPDKRSLFTPLI